MDRFCLNFFVYAARILRRHDAEIYLSYFTVMVYILFSGVCHKRNLSEAELSESGR